MKASAFSGAQKAFIFRIYNGLGLQLYNQAPKHRLKAKLLEVRY
jgi:hypothetical protein